MLEEAGGIRGSRSNLDYFSRRSQRRGIRGGLTRVLRMPNPRSMPDGCNGVLSGDHLVLESPCSPRFDGESWAIPGPTWKGFEHIRYIFIL